MNRTAPSSIRAMTLALALALTGIASTAIAATSPDSPVANPEDVYAFVNVELVSMVDDAIRSGFTVVVQGDRIIRVGPSSQVDIPDEATRIDGSGKYLMPGLAEMHGHVPSASANPASVEETLFLYAANGITTVRGMLGYAGQLALRERAAAGEIISPTLYLAGPSFNGNSVSSPEQAVEMVKAQVAEGWDLLKIHPGLTLAEYDAMATTANELGIRFGGHVPAAVGLEHAIAMGQETFDHLDGYVEAIADESGVVSKADVDRLVQLTVEAGAWVVPTMALWETLYGTASLDELQSFSELQYVPAGAVNNWSNQFRQRVQNPGYDPIAAANVIDSRMQILRALNDGGARVLMGTDAPQQFSVPGFSLHRELTRMVAAGMSAYDVLRSGTANVGEYFANEDAFGTIEPGKRADLVLALENPLDDITSVARHDGVMVRGRWLSRSAIDERLSEIAARHARAE